MGFHVTCNTMRFLPFNIHTCLVDIPNYDLGDDFILDENFNATVFNAF